MNKAHNRAYNGIMATASGILKSVSGEFSNAGIETASLDARILLETATGKTRSFFVANPDYALDENEGEKLRELVSRRLNREPVAQIIGKKEFWGRDFAVSRDVLTPRPESELIIEAALERLKKNAPHSFLDLGTGSGCLILTLLAEFPSAKGVGADISQTALAIAARNAYNLGIDRVELVLSEWCENIAPQRFDLIVANPPYIPLNQRNCLSKELSFEPDMALYSGDDGLDSYRQIAAQTGKFSPKLVILEIGIGQEDQVDEIFKGHGFNLKEMKRDLAGITRTLVFAEK